MVQGIAFLSKKSWHTKNRSNQEKVWIAEQKKEQELAKASELAREIQQERDAEELNRIAGKNITVKDRGINWMYQGSKTDIEIAKQDAAKRAEGFLLGKEFVGHSAVQGELHDDNLKGSIHNAVHETNVIRNSNDNGKFHGGCDGGRNGQNRGECDNLKSSSGLVNDAHDRNEDFRLRVEDPIYHVNQKRRESQNKHEQVNMLYERVVGTRRDGNGSSSGFESRDDYESSIRKSKRKRQKKDRRDRDQDLGRKKKRKKYFRKSSHKYERCGSNKHNQRRRRCRSRSHSYSRSRSRSCSSDRHQSKYYDMHDELDYRDKKQKKWYKSENPAFSGRGTKYCRKHCYQDEIYLFDCNSKTLTDEERRRNEENPKKIDGYGLMTASSAEKISNKYDIGPNEELLRKKREDVKRLKVQKRSIGRARKQLTKQQRERAIQEMQTNAHKREVYAAGT